MRGTRPADLLDRRHMLNVNLETLQRAMTEAVCDEPVGFVIDATDRCGLLLATHLLAAKDDISIGEAKGFLSRLTKEYREQGQYPTLVFAADWQFAETTLPKLSPTATANLKAARARLRAGQYLIIVVGCGGNTYAFTEINRPVPDGQHRASIPGGGR
ncbi:MAG: hypothetical protein J0I06_27875 [Planctomycetes bacterium]|nr:hypothetical protein [Planctomycetota bacterium]